MRKKHFLLLTLLGIMCSVSVWGQTTGDVITVSGVKYNVLSDNKISNSTFDDSFTGWTQANDFSTTITSSNFKISNDADHGNYLVGTQNGGSTAASSIGTAWTIDADKMYYFKYDIYAITGTNAGYIKTSLTNTKNTETSVLGTPTVTKGSWSTFEKVFTNSDGYAYIQVMFRWLNSQWGFDNFGLYEIEKAFDLTEWTNAKDAAQAVLDKYDSKYATTERQAVVDAMGVADPTTTDGLNSAINTLNSAVSAYETVAKAAIETERQEANVNGYNAIKTNYLYSYASLLNTDITQWTNNNYAGNNGSEHWSGVNSTYYYEQSSSEWGASSWSKAASQTVNLPKGNYAMVTTARASADVTSTMSVKVGAADAVTVTLPNKGSSGYGIDTDGNATFANDATYANTSGRGWEYRYIEFEVTEEAGSDVTISFASSTNVIHNWVSIANPILYGSVHPNQINLNKVNSLATELKTYEGNIATSVYANFATNLTNAANATVESTDLEDIISALTTNIATAKTAKVATDAIKAYLTYEQTNNPTVDFSSIDVLAYTAATDGKAAIKTLRNSEATKSMTAGQDLTGLIDNAGFELSNTDYWTVINSSDTGARETSNATYAMSGSEGSYLFNTWWQGTPITQNIGTLPAGAYEISATIASDGGTIYYLVNGNPNSYVEATDKTIGITGTSTFTLTEAQEVTIGVVGGANGTAGAHKEYTADGYWFYKVDNFQLKYLGATAPTNTLDGFYTLSTNSNYITRGGDSNTEAVMTATEDDALIAKITTDAAGIQTLQFADTEKYMMWNGEMVYTDGTIDPAKTHHLPYWKVTAVEGGYQILNTQSGKYLTTGTATRNETEITVATLSDTPATWTLTSMAYADDADYTALTNAISNAEANTLGFQTGEYAPYNNVAAIQALATAKSIDQTAQNLKKLVNNATTALTGATWIANTKEVNAVYDGSFNLTTIVRDASSYLPTGWNNTGYNTRVYKDASANAGIAACSQGACLFAKFTTEYGTVDGYTMPLKAGNYTLKFIYGGWNEIGTRDIKVYNVYNNATVTPVTITAKNNTAQTTASSWSTYEGMITIPTEGNYILSFYRENTSSQNQICISDIELYSTSVPASYNRETATDKFGTICVPYAFSTEGATLYSATINGDYVTLTEVTTTPVAGTPYIYQATADAQTFAYTSGAVVSAPVAADPLVGVFTATTISSGYILQDQGSGQKFYKVNSNIEIPANKAYLTTDASIKSFSIGFADDPTAINAVNSLVNGNAKIYDLNGRQLNSLKKGINIVNGVKVIVK